MEVLLGYLWLLICLVLFGVAGFDLILLHVELVLVVVKGDFDLTKALFAVIVVVVAGSGELRGFGTAFADFFRRVCTKLLVHV